MKMVSAAKLNKAQRTVADMLPYSAALNDIFRKVILSEEQFDTPLAQQREVKKVALVAFSSDSSLAGAFNSNVIKELKRTVDGYARLGAQNIYIYTIGKKVYEAVSKWGLPNVQNFVNLATKPDYVVAAGLAMHLIERFSRGEVDKVELIYHHFKSAGAQVVTRETLLPMAHPSTDGSKQNTLTDYIFEPSERKVLEELLPKSFKLKMYAALLDSNTSEHAARVIAMQTATENADNLISELTVQYNKSRQQAITNELLDIMGGKR
jgi:F-type H+-transporting ATPase subunit gamma